MTTTVLVTVGAGAETVVVADADGVAVPPVPLVPHEVATPTANATTGRSIRRIAITTHSRIAWPCSCHSSTVRRGPALRADAEGPRFVGRTTRQRIR
ncbi:hypothetical protein AS200_22680 [Streptomyces sp. CdTB01]|nr:hypothetical protein AS200_22680 [Streptomyces sp. CdTB01]